MIVDGGILAEEFLDGGERLPELLQSEVKVALIRKNKRPGAMLRAFLHFTGATRSYCGACAA